MNIIQGNQSLVLLKRISINHVNSILKENLNWKILDIGCGYKPHPQATVIADVQDFSNFYKEKEFVQIKEKKLPFKDKEFDFIISSHVIEHVKDFEFFIKELERISSRGYIELPTRLGDNLVFENKKDHIWWFLFDDFKKELIASKKNQLLDPFITVSMIKKLDKMFRESLIIELHWQKKINYRIDDSIKMNNLEKISFFKIFKKFLSKKFRTYFK